MGRRALFSVLAVTACACGPLDGFTLKDQSPPLMATLPVRCVDAVARTTGGTWVCQAENRIVTSRGQNDSTELQGKRVAVAGRAVWIWGDLLYRFEDPGTEQLVQVPDAGYDWAASIIPQPLKSFIAHEDQVVVAARGLEVVTAIPDGFVMTSKTWPGYQSGGHVGNTAWWLLDLGATLWASGPSGGGESFAFCPFSFDPGAGITGEGPCTKGPKFIIGTSSGGFWGFTYNDERPSFYRPAGSDITAVDGAVLPALKWNAGVVPWTTAGDGRTLLVPRMEGDTLILDRYPASEGYVWAGASEQWVFEVAPGGNTTRIYPR